MSKTGKFFLMALAVLLPIAAFAQAQAPVTLMAWLGQALTTVQDFISSNMTWQVKAAAVIALIISSMNVTVLNQWIWQKLGNFQIWLAPVLGLVGGLINVYNGGNWSDVLSYAVAGGGAVFVHELLDLIKVLPGIGSLWVSLINMIENIPVVGTQSMGKSPTKTS